MPNFSLINGLKNGLAKIYKKNKTLKIKKCENGMKIHKFLKK